MPRLLSIEPRRSGNARLPWVVHIPGPDRARYDGQKRRYFVREGEANTFAKALRRARSEHTAAFNQLPDAKKQQAHEAFEILAPYPDASLVQIVREYAARMDIASRSKLLPELIAALIEQKKEDHRRPAYVRDLRIKLNRFAAGFSDRLASSITPEEIGVWLREGGLRPASRDSYRRCIGVMFSWAKERGFVASNPVLETKAVNARREHEITILAADDLTRLILNAPERIRPYIVLCAFAALRPAECQRLQWDTVKPSAGVYVPKSGGKKGSRLVPILPALQTWLDFFGARFGAVCPPYGTWRKEFRKATEAAGWARGDWPQDALRHSAISYWLAVEPNREAVAKWSGNSVTVQTNHYDNPRSAEEAAAWFAVGPEILNNPSVGR